MSVPFGPPLEVSEENDYACMDQEVTDGIYRRPCPTLMGCYENATGSPQCQCGSVIIPGNFPDCNEWSDQSWLVALLCGVSVLLTLWNMVWSVWIIWRLHTLKVLTVNAVTKALAFCTLSSIPGFIHRFCEFAQMFIQSEEFHLAYYYPGE